MRITVKICGLTEAEGLRAAMASGADLAGFVFAAGSPRVLTPEAAAALFAAARGRIESAALLVDPDDELADAAMRVLRPDWLQLHGTESPARAAALKARYGVKLIKALGVAGPADLAEASAFEGTADLLLLDAKPPKGATRAGGHGTAFDWTVLKGFRGPTPFLLAGGLQPTNVANAIAAMRDVPGFAGVDVSSGVERAPGLKEPSAIAAFIATARRAADEQADDFTPRIAHARRHIQE